MTITWECSGAGSVWHWAECQHSSRQGQRLLEHVSAVTGRCRVKHREMPLKITPLDENDSLMDIVLSFDLFSNHRPYSYSEGNCPTERTFVGEWAIQYCWYGVYPQLLICTSMLYFFLFYFRAFNAPFLTLSPKGF